MKLKEILAKQIISNKLKKKAGLKMTRNRGGYDVGPLPSIEEYTDYSNSYKIDLFWYDTSNNINIVKKHIARILLEWIRYSQEEVEYIMNNFVKIEKAKGRNLDGSETDLPGYNVNIEGMKDEIY